MSFDITPYSPIISGIDLPTRSLCSASDNDDAIHFLLGTNSLTKKNKIYVIEVLEESNSLKKYYADHEEGQIWDISSSYQTTNMFSTCYRVGTINDKFEGAIFTYKINEYHDEFELNRVSSIKSINCTNIDWNTRDQPHIVACGMNCSKIFDVSNQKFLKEVASYEVEKGGGVFQGSRWNPHSDAQTFSHFNVDKITTFDVRKKEPCHTFQACDKRSIIFDMNFNPNVPETLVSAGSDSFIRFWDLRNTKKSLLSRKDHSNGVLCARYNFIHDQLLLTSGNDLKVLLLNISSVSSEGVLQKSESKGKSQTNGNNEINTLKIGEIVSTCELHDDSVYSLEFSKSHPWFYASVSYDGRIAISKVPEIVRSKIF